MTDTATTVLAPLTSRLAAGEAYRPRTLDALRIAEQVLVNKRSRENAEKTRLNLKKKLAGTIDLANRVQKFVDCRTKDTARREIYIVEGDSALGACKLSRDAEFQAIIPVRGKILNCLKAEYDKIFKNDIITDIIKVLGCRMGNIAGLFLCEAAYIGLFGGALGLGVSYGLSQVINMLVGGSGFRSVIPLYLAAGALGFSVLVAMISGLYPALRAMRLSPLTAIRNE